MSNCDDDCWLSPKCSIYFHLIDFQEKIFAARVVLINNKSIQMGALRAPLISNPSHKET